MIGPVVADVVRPGRAMAPVGAAGADGIVGLRVASVTRWVREPVLPEGSVTSATIVISPLLIVAAVTFQDPPGCTVACNVWPAAVTTAAEPTGASVVPWMDGVGSLVESGGPLAKVTVGGCASM